MSTTVAPAARPNLTAAEMIDRYIKLRDKVAEIKKVHSAQLAPFAKAMEQLEGFLLDDLNQAGGNSLNTNQGTAYKVIHTSATVQSWADTLDYIRDNEAWELLEARVSKTAVLAITEELAEKAKQARAEGRVVTPAMLVVPGVKITQEVGLNVRRS